MLPLKVPTKIQRLAVNKERLKTISRSIQTISNPICGSMRQFNTWVGVQQTRCQIEIAFQRRYYEPREEDKIPIRVHFQNDLKNQVNVYFIL